MKLETALVALSVTTLLGVVSVNAAEPDWQKPNSYDFACNIDVRGPGWTPRSTFFTLEPEKKRVRVLDPVLLYSTGKPAIAKIVKSHPDIVRFRWRVNVPADDGQLVSVGYRVDFDPKSLTGTINLSLRSNAGAVTPGRLVCKRQ